MRISKGAWCLLCTVICVSAHPGKKPSTELHAGGVKTCGLKTTAVDHDLEDGPAVASKDVEIEVDEYGRELIPMKLANSRKINFSATAFPLEPDAEMLPAHYARVKPPGVDHMELRYAEPETEESNFKSVLLVKQPAVRRVAQAAGDRYASSKQTSLVTRVDQGGEKASGYQEASKGDEKRQRQKGQYTEAKGKKKERSEEGKEAGHSENSAGERRGSDYEVKSKENKAEKSGGYRNVYHKDEHKKNADYYDNEDHGGKFKKHDRYKETFTATEDMYKKGAARNSGAAQGQFGKAGTFEKGQKGKDAKVYDGREAHAEFFKNLRQYGKTSGSGNGKIVGFVAKTR